jgi:2-amino-4-hydroxy-6-hydroxymethyldihydropteridine diphosphokinase
MATVYISFGSNMGDRADYLRRAIELSSSFIKWVKISPFVETEPYGKVDQPPFLNAIGKGETKLNPNELLTKLKQVEQLLGRERFMRWGPRTIDLDILSYENVVLKNGSLTIPHPDLQNRAFLLTLLCNYFPEWRHPSLGKNGCELLGELTTRMPAHFQNSKLRFVMGALGNPQDSLKTVYVSGSSGKGSVAAMLAALFNENVGLFVSPYVCSPDEMVKINGKSVDLTQFKQRIISTSYDLSLELTPFEITTGSAYLAFAENDVEWAVIETGLESKQDATNIKDHQISVVTPLGNDHADMFPTWEVYYNELLSSLSGQIVTMDDLPGIDIKPVKSKYVIERSNISLDGTEAYVRDVGWIKTKMLGLHQIWNALLAGEAFSLSTGKTPDYQLVQDVFLPARLQVVRRDPLLIVDGGHNEPAFKALVETLRLLDLRNLRIILGLVNGKDVDAALSELSKLGSNIWYFPPFSERALFEVEGLPKLNDLFEALEEPVPTVVAGSFYLAGPVLKHMKACA